MEESKTEKKLTLSDFMMKEAEDTFRMFRDDLKKLQDSMKTREIEMDKIKAEQLVDYQSRLKVEGALSACQHLVTKYKEAWAQDRAENKPKRRGRKTVNG